MISTLLPHAQNENRNQQCCDVPSILISFTKSNCYVFYTTITVTWRCRRFVLYFRIGLEEYICHQRTGVIFIGRINSTRITDVNVNVGIKLWLNMFVPSYYMHDYNLVQRPVPPMQTITGKRVMVLAYWKNDQLLQFWIEISPDDIQ